MIIDIGSGNKNINFHQGGGGKKVNVEERKSVTYTDNGTFTVDADDGYDAIKGADVTVDVNTERGSKAWWEKVLKGSNINGIYYDKDNLTDVLYSQDNINKYYDSNGNEISVYDASGNQIENHLGILNPNGHYNISIYDNVETITFSDLANGISNRHELKRDGDINETNGIDNNSYNGIIITPTAFITSTNSGYLDKILIKQYKNLLPIFYLYDMGDGTYFIENSYDPDGEVICDKPYGALKENNKYELKDFKNLSLISYFMNYRNYSGTTAIDRWPCSPVNND